MQQEPTSSKKAGSGESEKAVTVPDVVDGPEASNLDTSNLDGERLKPYASGKHASWVVDRSVIDLKRSQEQIDNSMRIREDSVMAVMKSLAALDDFYRTFYGDALSAAGEPILERYPA